MKIGEADLEQSFYQSVRRSSDKTVGYVFVVLTVLCLFSLYLLGMHRVQAVSQQVVGDHSRLDSAPEPEISDSVDSKNR